MRDQVKLRDAAADDGGDIEGWDGYRFDSKRKTVTFAGRLIPTSVKEFDLALLLFRNLSKALSRDAIMHAVWGYAPGEPTRTLDAHISQIRTRLRLDHKNGFLLASVYRFGYRLERLDAWGGTQPRDVVGVAKS